MVVISFYNYYDASIRIVLHDEKLKMVTTRSKYQLVWDLIQMLKVEIWNVKEYLN